MVLNGNTLTVNNIVVCKYSQRHRPFLACRGRAFLVLFLSIIFLDFLICSFDLSSVLTLPIGFPPYRPFFFPFAKFAGPVEASPASASFFLNRDTFFS